MFVVSVVVVAYADEEEAHLGVCVVAVIVIVVVVVMVVFEGVAVVFRVDRYIAFRFFIFFFLFETL